MSVIQVENLGILTVVQCRGSVTGTGPTSKLRNLVQKQTSVAQMIVVDLSEVEAVDDQFLMELAHLKRWARDLKIQFKLYSPLAFIVDKMERDQALHVEIATFQEMIAILSECDERYSLAA